MTWIRIGVADKKCRGCGNQLRLRDVAHFGTDVNGVRFVECIACFGQAA